MIAGKYSDPRLIMPLKGIKIINNPSDNAVFEEVGKVKIFHVFLHGYNRNCGQRSVRLENISRLTDLQHKVRALYQGAECKLREHVGTCETLRFRTVRFPRISWHSPTKSVRTSTSDLK